MDFITNFIKGVAVGIATLVPGVSGGTMAIILGVYDRLIHSVGSFFEDWKKNFMFLFQVGSGALLGFLLFSRLMENAITAFPHIMQFLFMGIIIGGLPVLYRKSVSAGRGSLSDIIFLISGAAIVLLTMSEPEAIVNVATDRSFSSYVFLLFLGVFLSIALVLPGISFSFTLLAFGIYGVTLNAVNNLDFPFLVPLGIGIAAGVLGTSKIIERFLQKYPRETYMFIIGLVLGSLVEVFPGIPQGWQIIACAVAFAAGFAIIYMLGKKGITIG